MKKVAFCVLCTSSIMSFGEPICELERIVIAEGVPEYSVDFIDDGRTLDFGDIERLPCWDDLQGSVTSVVNDDDDGRIFEIKILKHRYSWIPNCMNKIASCMFSIETDTRVTNVKPLSLPCRVLTKKNCFDDELMGLLRVPCIVSHFGIVTIPNAIQLADVLDQNKSRERIVRIKYLLCCVDERCYVLLYEALDLDRRNRRGVGRIDFKITGKENSVQILSSRNFGEIGCIGVNFVATQSFSFVKPIQNILEVLFTFKTPRREDRRSVLKLHEGTVSRHFEMLKWTTKE